MEPITLRYDFSRSFTDREAGWNQGCPLGYFAQFVALDAEDAQPTEPGRDTGVRCRLLPVTDEAAGVDDLPRPGSVWDIGSPAMQAIAAESGVSWGESFENYRRALRDSLPAIGANLRGLGLGLGLLAAFVAWRSLR